MLESQQVLPHLAEGRQVFTNNDRAETNHLLMACGVWTRGPSRLSSADSLGWVMSFLEETALYSGSEGRTLVPIGSHPAADGSLGTGERGVKQG